MRGKCVFLGILSIIIFGVTACGLHAQKETVVAQEPQVIVLKDELVVPAAYTIVEETVEQEKLVEEIVSFHSEDAIEESYIVMPSDNIEKEIADGKIDMTDLVVDVDGIEVSLGADISELMKGIGYPDEFLETVKNPRIGSNKEYTYDGIVIHTSPEAGRDLVSCIEYQGTEKTPSGIGIGSTRADIEAAYGISYIMDPDYMTYICNEDSCISFRMDGEKCIFIEISKIEE